MSLLYATTRAVAFMSSFAEMPRLPAADALDAPAQFHAFDMSLRQHIVLRC